MYAWIRPLLFCLDAERAHTLALVLLKLMPVYKQQVAEPVRAMGLTFPNVVGLAAGFDKNGAHLAALAKLGFGFIEVGTVTPKAQPGNPKPRLFRVPQRHAIINRMGFNNDGVHQLIANVQQANYHGILGINIGKNKDTPLSLAMHDYAYCMQQVYPHASYVTINISSPNTPDLRALQHPEYFRDLISHLREEQLHLADTYQRYVPLVVKISPDETDDTLKRMADVIVALGIDGIIATNTTSQRPADVSKLRHGGETGGLSGRPLLSRATECLRILKTVVGHDVTLIGVGGIDNIDSATEKLTAGAKLIQVYSGLIYQGPDLIRRLSQVNNKE